MRSVYTPLLAAILAASCDSAARAPDLADGEVPASAERAAGTAQSQSPVSLQTVWAEQKLIRTAELRLQVDSVPLAVEEADSMSREFQAFLADMSITQDDEGRRSANLVIRVPTASFSDLLDELRSLGEIRTDAVTTEDVTKAYADLETRLAVKEETAARLRQLLAGRTGNLSDVLDVERELSRVVTEIEQMKGERRFYDQRIAVSTINLRLFEAGALLRTGSAAPISEAFGRSLYVLSVSVSWLLYILVFLTPWVVIGGLGWWVVRRVRARRSA